MEYVLIVWEQSIPGFLVTPRTFLSWPEAWSPDSLLDIISSLVTFQKIKWNYVSLCLLCVHCLGQTGPSILIRARDHKPGDFRLEPIIQRGF